MKTTKPKWICLKDEQPKYMAEAVMVLVDEEDGTVMNVYNGFFVPPFRDNPLKFCARKEDGRHPTNEGGFIPISYIIPQEAWANLYYFVYNYDELEEQFKNRQS